jgi:hypothetical protein
MVQDHRDQPFMREIVFRVLSDRPGQIEATAEDRPITITAASLEDLHHEAREALIQHLGAAHSTFRVRIRGGAAAPAPMPIARHRHAACC